MEKNVLDFLHHDDTLICDDTCHIWMWYSNKHPYPGGQKGSIVY